jgi:hypothetical protein
MSNLEGVKAAVERWMGRVGSDASAHVDKPTVVTVTLHPTEQPKIEVAHVDGSDEEKPAAGRSEQYGTPVHPEGVTPFGSSGLQGRQWADKPPAGSPERSADLQHVQETGQQPGDTVVNGPGQPDGINAGVVSDGGSTPVVPVV